MLRKFLDIGKGGTTMNPVVSWFRNLVIGYNHEKFWKRREMLITPGNGCSTIRRLYYLYYIKKVERRWNCSMGENEIGFVSPAKAI